MKWIWYFVFCLLVCLIFFSCKNHSDLQMKNLLLEYVNKKIYYPEFAFIFRRLSAKS